MRATVEIRKMTVQRVVWTSAMLLICPEQGSKSRRAAPDRTGGRALLHRCEVLRPGMWRRHKARGHLNFSVATARQTLQAPRDAGFREVTDEDRQLGYAGICAHEVAAIAGDLRADIIAVSSPEIYENWLHAQRVLAEPVASGGLCPTHLRGIRPGA